MSPKSRRLLNEWELEEADDVDDEETPMCICCTPTLLENMTWSNHFAPYGMKVENLEWADFGDFKRFNLTRTPDGKKYWVWYPPEYQWTEMDPLEAQSFMHVNFSTCWCG